MINGKTVLVLQKAGDKTLAAELRPEGVPGLEMLARYGDDLLSAVSSLERHGVAHRDIKPDNIGIRSLTKAAEPIDPVRFLPGQCPAGQHPCGHARLHGPVPGQPQAPDDGTWQAERYSAAVTLYEMTLGSGVLPQWGDGKSDPAMTDDELVIDAEKFDSERPGRAGQVLRKALHRDPAKRFDNADEMRLGVAGGLQGGRTAEDHDA